MGGDLFYQFCLEYLQAAAQSDHHAAAHSVRSLFEKAVRRFCRMRVRQDFKKAIQGAFGIQGEQAVHLPDVAFCRGIA